LKPLCPQGPIGPRGPEGPMGPAGTAGPYGPEGPTGSQGVQGPVGDQGPQGPQGPAGPAGPQGMAGPAGPQGPQGPAGPRGPTGAVGPAGANGMLGPQGSMGETGCSGEQGMSSHEVHYFDTSMTVASANPGNYQTLKLFFIPAGTLTARTAVRLLALSHATSVGDSAFRIRVEDTLFNNIMVEVDADYDVHKIGAYVSLDSATNGVHLYTTNVCCNAPQSALSSTISATRDLFVFYEVRIETTGQQWTSDFLFAELLTDFQ